MKTVIRRGVFETNSSSTHSLSIADSHDYIKVKVNEDNNIVIYGEFRFGWGYDELFDFEDKVAYYYLDNMYDEDSIDLLKEVIIDETGANDVIFDIDEEYSWIDHQSHGTTDGLTREELKDFLFNPNSYIILKNDNDYD